VGFSFLDGFVLGHEFVGEIVFVDIVYIHDRFTSDLPGGDDFHIVEPLVRVEALSDRVSPKLGDPRRPRVIGSKSE